ncbi:MAG: MORN repeat-containing protein [Acidobacteriota bacterium]
MYFKWLQLKRFSLLTALLSVYLVCSGWLVFAAELPAAPSIPQDNSASVIDPNMTSAVSTAPSIQNGKVQITYADGTVYSGVIRNGKPEGAGTCQWSNGDSYSGQFADGVMNGQGSYRWADGEKYIGAFVNGRRTGQGVYTWPRGAQYKGEFSDDRFNGTGELIWPTDRYYGKGLIVQPSGSKVAINDAGFNYKGSFRNGVMHGPGVYTWSNGDKYIGDFQSGKRTGSGTYTWSNGNSYTGDFVNDNLAGFGSFKWANGDVLIGSFTGGMPSGYGRFITNKKEVIGGNWDKGVLTAGGVDVFNTIPNDIYNTQPVTFSWTFDGKPYEVGPVYVSKIMLRAWQINSKHNPLFTWGVQIPPADSINTYMQDLSNNDLTNAVAFALNETALKEGFKGAKLINFVASFVKSLPNNKDPLNDTFDSYTKLPYEVLFQTNPLNLRIDSEDAALLTAMLLQKMGFYTAILYMPSGIPNHAAVGVKGDVSFPAQRFYYKGAWYYYLETTAVGQDVGVVPKSVSTKAVEIVPLPDPVGGRLLYGSNK